MDSKQRLLLIGGAGLVGGLIILYKKSHEAKEGSLAEQLPLNANAAGTEPQVSSGGGGAGAGPGEVQSAELRSRLEAQEGIANSQLGFYRELVGALESRPSGVQELISAKQNLEALGIPVGFMSHSPESSATPSTTNSIHSESGPHTPSGLPTVVSGTIQALEAIPNTAHQWILNTTKGSPGYGHYYYNSTENGKPVHLYHASNLPGFTGKHHNAVYV